MRIYLVGFMGSGKTTYGRELAKALGYGFIDLDEEIERSTGKTITQWFDQEGDDAFRKIESETLRNTDKSDDVVVATGGGAAAYTDSMEWMNAHGKTVYLKLFETTLHERLKERQADRPLLRDIPDDELLHFIYEALRKRAYYYHQAQIVVDPLSMKADELAAMLKGA